MLNKQEFTKLLLLERAVDLKYTAIGVLGGGAFALASFLMGKINKGMNVKYLKGILANILSEYINAIKQVVGEAPSTEKEENVELEADEVVTIGVDKEQYVNTVSNLVKDITKIAPTKKIILA